VSDDSWVRFSTKEATLIMERTGHLSAKAAQALRVRSALNPLLWLCAIIAPFSLFIASQAENLPVLIAALIMAGAPILTTCIGFFYFLFRAPEKLQSEDYQLRHETLQMIKVSNQPISLDRVSLGEIASGEKFISAHVPREDQA
jgi:hypothetical protein